MFALAILRAVLSACLPSLLNCLLSEWLPSLCPSLHLLSFLRLPAHSLTVVAKAWFELLMEDLESQVQLDFAAVAWVRFRGHSFHFLFFSLP
jgi:hypothetical protein